MATNRKQRKSDTTPQPNRRKKGAQPGNSNAAAHSFYSDQFDTDELALIASFLSDLTLTDEIWMQRVLNRRLLAHLNTTNEEGNSPTIEELTKVAEALATGTGRVARLLRDQRALSGEAADGIADAISKALDELGSELGLPL